METRRLRLEGASLPELQDRVRAEHGASARIIAAEQVTVGGIRGFFAKRHIEVTVEVAADEPPEVLVQVPSGRRRAGRARNELSIRLGIAALLDDADAAEATLYPGGLAGGFRPASEPAPFGGSPAAALDPAALVQQGTGRRAAAQPAATQPGIVHPEAGQPAAAARPAAAHAAAEAVSTGTPDFARLMDELTFATSPARGWHDPAGSGESASTAAPGGAAAEAASPGTLAGPRTSAWDAVAVTDPEAAVASSAAALSITPGAPVLLAGPGDLVLLVGAHADVQHAARLLSMGADARITDSVDTVADRRSALAVRARGVEQGRAVLIVCGLSDRPDAAASAALTVVGADQVWAVVHAGRKPADTARWVRDVGAIATIDALAVLGIESTGTPGTVRELGLPIGWLAPVPAASAGPSLPFAIG